MTSATGATERPRILLIDDNPDDRRLVRRALEREIPGLEIEEVPDAAALSATLDRGVFDIVVTDYGLRWSDGLSVLREIRRRYPDRPVVMFTGTGSQEIAVEAMKAGLTDYIVKTPKQYGQLPYIVRAALDRRREQLALAEVERRYRDLVNLLPAVIEITALDERATPEFVSPHLEGQLGWSPEEWLGDPDLWLSSIHPDDRDEVLAAHRRQVASHEPIVAEYRLRRRDGRWIWVRVASVVIDAGGTPKALGVVFDVTDRRRLEDDLRQAQKMEALGRLAGGVAHDFNNLLTVIGGHADFLAGDLDVADPRRGDAEAIRDAADKAASLTRQLLAFSRRQPLRPERLDVREVIGRTASLLRRLSGPEVRIEIDVADEPLLVVIDQTQLEQVLMNLAVNAADAMADGGTLTIAARAEGDEAVLAATDTGVGMTDEVQARLFEPFFTTKTEGQGTGLGLATVFAAVEGAGGRISVRSRVGLGSTFEIRLPMAVDRREDADARQAGPDARGSAAGAARPATPPDGPDLSSRPAAGGTVLLVDDEEGVRRLAKRILTRAGFRVIEAGGGDAAVRLAGDPSVGIDLLLTDIVMPGLLGSEVAAAVARIRPGTPTIFMSAFADAAVLEDLPGPVLAKPFAAEELLARVRAVLGAEPAAG